jgi:hypothetical protein
MCYYFTDKILKIGVRQMREVSVRTEYTQENMLKFFKFNLFSRNKAVVIGFIVLYAALFVFNIYNVVAKLTNGIKLGMNDYIAIVIVIFCSYWIYSRFFIMPKKLARKNDTGKTLVSDVTVSDDGLSINISDADGSDSQTLSYSEIFKIYETDGFFYVFRTKAYAYILDKNGCTSGNSEGLRALFSAHCTKKQYKNGTFTASVQTEEK